MGEMLDDLSPNEMQAKLSSMSFEDLQKLKAELGTKLYNEAMFGGKPKKETNFKRETKNRPREVSSKIKPKLELVKTKRKQIRDPRFDSLCGTFNKDSFAKNYNFINDIKTREKSELKEMLKNSKNEKERENIKFLIKRFENQERERLKMEKKNMKVQEERKEQIKALNSGKKPYFKSKYERKVGDIVEKYEELKKSGKLLKYIEKRQRKMGRKKNNKFEDNVFSQENS